MAHDMDAIANAVIETYYDSWTDLEYDPKGNLIGLAGAEGAEHVAFPVTQRMGGVASRFLVLADVADAEEFDEYDEPIAVAGDTWIVAEPDTISVWRKVLHTGFMQDATFGEADLINYFAQEAKKSVMKIRVGLVNALLGTTVKGVLGWIDNAVAAGGINRSTYTAWQSYVDDLNSAKISRAAMEDCFDAVRAGTRNAPEHELEWWTSTTQERLYKRLPLGGERVELTGGHLDMGYTSISHEGRPIRTLPGFATDTWALVHKPSVAVEEVRPLTLVKKSYGGDGDAYLMSARVKLKVDNPQMCGKIEDCATS